MIYGTDFEGCRRECSNCGRLTSDVSYCETCNMVICDGCEHTCIPALGGEPVAEIPTEGEPLTETN